MVDLESIINYINDYLQVEDVADYCPNGMQVEGNRNVCKIATSVSANLEFFEKAKECGANLLLVHHGIVWDSHKGLIKGSFRKRIKYLLDNNLTLLAYHLPLDMHPQIGNNVLSCLGLNIVDLKPFGKLKNSTIGFWGKCDSITPDALKKKVDKYFAHTSLMFSFGKDTIQSVGVISGGAQGEFQQAIDLNLDCYITGEVSENVMHLAKEEGMHFIAAGHYATERAGIKALGELVGKNFKVEVEFIDVPVPV